MSVAAGPVLDIPFFCEVAELLRTEIWASVTDNGFRYAVSAKWLFTDGCKGCSCRRLDSPVVGEAGGDQVVAAVVYKDVCANFLSVILQCQCGSFLSRASSLLSHWRPS